MRTARRLAFVVLAVGLATVPARVPADAREVLRAAFPSPTVPAPQTLFRAGELIVQFRASVDELTQERALREVRPRAARRARASGRYLVDLGADAAVPAALDRLARMPEVDYVERNGVLRKTQARTFVPNDRFYEFQWNFQQIGSERTWGIQQGRRTVGVAVLDTGIAYEDYFDPRDGRQYVKAPDWGDTPFLPGFDFVNGDDHANDDEFHGTHVSATIAEAANNVLGVTGLAFGVSLMPVKVLDSLGEGSFFDVAAGIDFATDFSQGETRIRVINMSLGGQSSSEAVRRAVERAVASGIVVVAAAGNDSRPTLDYPAALPDVIAVGAVDARKNKAYYSNFGPGLSVVAPGGDCRVDTDNDGLEDCVFQQMIDSDFVELGRYDVFCYCGLQGTSQAAPHVAALAALLFSQGMTDPAAVRAAIEQTAERLGGTPAGGRDDSFGNGLIRPAAALAGLGLNQGPN